MAGLSFQHQILGVPGHWPVLQELHGSELGRQQEQKHSHLPGVPWRPSCLVDLEILEGPVGGRGHLEAMVGQGSQWS